jgi:cyanate permease
MIGAFIGPYAFGLARDVTDSYSAGLLLVAALYMLAISVRVLLVPTTAGRRSCDCSSDV